MSIHPRNKSNSFTHKRTFLSALTVMNKKFIVNPVGRIRGSNLSQNSTYTVTNYSLFTRQNNSSFTTLLIDVDDILFTGNDLTEIQRVKDCLLQQFRIKDLRHLKYFLGIEFSRSKAGIYVSQRKYVDICRI